MSDELQRDGANPTAEVRRMEERPRARGARRIGERLSYANVMASVAVFIALGGSAWAVAANSVGTKQLKDNAVKTKKIAKNAVKTPKIANGAVTAEKLAGGAEALQGPAGPAGSPGSPAASMITGALDFSIGNSSGGSLSAPVSGTVSEALAPSQLSPNATTIARDLAFSVASAPGSGASVSATLSTGTGPTPVTCTISGSATTCNSGATTATIPPASRLWISLSYSSTSGPFPPTSGVRWAFRALTP